MLTSVDTQKLSGDGRRIAEIAESTGYIRGIRTASQNCRCALSFKMAIALTTTLKRRTGADRVDTDFIGHCLR